MTVLGPLVSHSRVERPKRKTSWEAAPLLLGDLARALGKCAPPWKTPVTCKSRAPQQLRDGVLGTHLGAGGVSLAAAVVVAAAAARLGVGRCPRDGWRLGGRGRVPAPSPVTRRLPPDILRPLCVSVCVSSPESAGHVRPQPLPPRHRDFIAWLLATMPAPLQTLFGVILSPGVAATAPTPPNACLSSTETQAASRQRQRPELDRYRGHSYSLHFRMWCAFTHW